MKNSQIKKFLTILIIVVIALIIFRQNPVMKEYNDYHREAYKHWVDADGDCQNTRQEVLILESLEKVILDEKNCKVLSGKWYDPYTDQYFTDPKDLDIDHFVPLKEVDRSGGSSWDLDKKMRYANDLNDAEVLIAVSKIANRSKGDKDPSEWLPSNEKYRCEYVENWVLVKKKWGLFMDEKEKSFIEDKQKNCLKILH
jgi:hypothetical protein